MCPVDQLAEYFRNSRVLVWGLGREGKSSVKFLSEVANVQELAVMDSDSEVVKSTAESFAGSLKVVTSTEEFRNFNIILKAPGISVHKLQEKLRAQDLAKISSQVDVFLQLFGAQTIGITGTKGKSTTASLIHHILKKCSHDAVLGGNIGVPVFELVSQCTKSSKIVLELSSHQLEFLKRGPHIALLLNLFQDHLDHYADLTTYHQAKLNAVKCQTPEDFLVYDESVEPKVRAYLEDRQPSRQLSVSGAEIEELKAKRADEISGVDFQNAHNVVFARRTLVNILGISETAFFEHLSSFKTLEHRLEHFATLDEVEYYDDSISTIPEATILAVSALESAHKSVGTVILGGMDRGIDYAKLVESLSTSRISHVILLPNTGARITQHFRELGSKTTPEIHSVQNLEEAVRLAKTATPRKTACLLSPAAASYGTFKNFHERGVAFQQFVRAQRSSIS